MMDLFSSPTSEPLASRMRPRTLDEYVGQEHILGKGRLLRRAIQADRLSSVILYGPPGTGKTTLARVIANTTESRFQSLNAVLSGVNELRKVIEGARDAYELYGERTILFVDEVHRWNKSQQDALLPWVENGTFILIGATTENPFFEVNSALVSRSRIFRLVSLTDENLKEIALRALGDRDRGYGRYDIRFEEGALEHIVKIASGDARSLLNAIELAVETSDGFPPEEGARIFISKEDAEESIQKKVVLYDKEGDYHFDVISAFIKSLRGSDPDASLYWLARMVDAGEDPKFIFRRMMILASEDIGMADPFAVSVVVADAEAFDRVGLPEGRYHLAHSVLYLSTCPKSNSVMAFFDALSDVRKQSSEVPVHLKDASRDSKGFGHGKGYIYPHSYREHWKAQQYLPDALQGRIYYRPTEMGYEKSIRSSVNERREVSIEAAMEAESLTYSPDSGLSEWVERTLSGRGDNLRIIREKLYEGLFLMRHENTVVLNASGGLLVWPLIRMCPEGLCVANVSNEDEKDAIMHLSSEIDDLVRPVVIVSPPSEVFDRIEKGTEIALVSGRNVLTRLNDGRAVLERIPDSAKIAFAETIPSSSTRLSDIAQSHADELRTAEKDAYSKSEASSWGGDDLKDMVLSVFPNAQIEIIEMNEKRLLTPSSLVSFYRKIYSNVIGEKEFLSLFPVDIVDWKSRIAIIKAGF